MTIPFDLTGFPFLPLPLDGGGQGEGGAGQYACSRPPRPPIPAFPRQGGRGNWYALQKLLSRYLGLSPGSAAAAAKPQQVALLVSAASDLTPAFQEIGALFEQATGMKVRERIVVFTTTGQAVPV